MATIYNALYKRFNGVDWDTFYFASTASQVSESATRKWLSADQQTAIGTYLEQGFNTPGKLTRTDPVTGLIPTSVIPELNYLSLLGGSLTGDLAMTGNDLLNVGSVETNALIRRGVTAAELSLSGYSQINVGGVKLVNLADPTSGQDAATRSYVDMVAAQGSHLIAAVKAASTGDIPTLSGTTTIDGVNLYEGDRILVKNQTNASQNGVYVVQLGAWTKLPNDSDKSSLVSVLEGETQTRHQYYNQDGTTWGLFWVDDDYGIIANGGLELDNTGLKFGIANGGVTTDRILNAAVTNEKISDVAHGKITSWASSLAISISNPTASKSLNEHFQNTYKMIQLIKGTTNAHDTLNDSMVSIRTDVNLKNRTFIGSAAPSTSGFTAGDLYFHHT